MLETRSFNTLCKKVLGKNAVAGLIRDHRSDMYFLKMVSGFVNVSTLHTVKIT